jgi:hypothetical protein
MGLVHELVVSKMRPTNKREMYIFIKCFFLKKFRYFYFFCVV